MLEGEIKKKIILKNDIKKPFESTNQTRDPSHKIEITLQNTNQNKL